MTGECCIIYQRNLVQPLPVVRITLAVAVVTVRGRVEALTRVVV